MTLKEIAEHLALPYSRVAFRLHQLRLENPECADFKSPFNERTLKEIDNFLIRDSASVVPNGTHERRKHHIKEGNKKFYAKFLKPGVLYYTCKDGIQIRGNRLLSRWVSLGYPDVDNPDLPELLFCSSDNKVFNKLKKEKGYSKPRNKAFSYIIDDCFRCLTTDTPEVKAQKIQNRLEAKAIQEEFGTDWQRAQAEWLLEHHYIDYDTYWFRVDYIESRKTQLFYERLGIKPLIKDKEMLNNDVDDRANV